MKNSIAKGRRGEQEVARMLYKAHYGTKPPADRQVFIRVGFGRSQPQGDLIVPPDFPFTVEVKNREVPLHRLPQEVCEWLTPYLADGDLKGSMLLIFKHQRKWWVVLVKAFKFLWHVRWDILPRGRQPIYYFCLHFDNMSYFATLMPLELFCHCWSASKEVIVNEEVSENPQLAQIAS